jgi:hypothetical protein
VRIAICHCIDCQRRTGSVFGATARFPRAQVTKIEGRSTTFNRVADSGNGITFHFCPDCGTTVYWEPARFPDTIAVAVGTFADPDFPAPGHSVYERRRHPWVDTSIAPEHMD